MYGLVESILPSGYIKRLQNEKNFDDAKLTHYIQSELNHCIEFMRRRDRDFYSFLQYEAGCYKMTECNFFDVNLGHLTFTIGNN